MGSAWLLSVVTTKRLGRVALRSERRIRRAMRFWEQTTCCALSSS
jgi:hypothetical protein